MKKYTSYLSKAGYVLRKSEYSDSEIINIKAELTAQPLGDESFASPPSYPVYLETVNKLYLPKMYGISTFGLPTLNSAYQGSPWTEDIKFKGELYPRQQKPADVLVASCLEKGGGILSLSTGGGKTFVALYVLSILAGKTIIVVNKVPLMKQWQSEIARFLPSAKIAILQGQKYDSQAIQEADIVITMLQSASKADYPRELFADFQVAIVDECHNTSSQMFSKVFFKICSKYTIGLSATPKRKDGLENIFKWHLGEIVYDDKIEGTDSRQGLVPIIRTIKLRSEKYREFFTDTRTPRIMFTSMLSDLVEMPERNRLITNTIIDLASDPNRKILVLSDRREHLKLLCNKLDAENRDFSYGLFLGAMSQAILDNNRKCRVILATFSAFGEGVSEKDLDTLVLTTPKKYIGHRELQNGKKESGKLEQIVGRIFRKDHLLRPPVIVDFCDNFSVYRSQFQSRIVFYKKHLATAKIENLTVNLDDPNQIRIGGLIPTTVSELVFNKCLIED